MLYDWTSTAALGVVRDIQPKEPLTLTGEGLWVCLVSSGRCTASLTDVSPSPAGSALILPPQSAAAGHLVLSRAPLTLTPEGESHLLCIQLTGQGGGAVGVGDAGVRLGRRLCLGLWLAGRLRAAGVSGPYGFAFGLGCPWLLGSLPRRGLVGRERLRGGRRLAGRTLRLGRLRPGRLRAAGGSGPYGRPFGLGLLDRGRFLLLGRCLF